MSVLLLLAAATSGTLSTYLYEEDAPLLARLATGTVLGVAAVGLIGFVLASLLGLGPVSLALTVAIGAFPAALATRLGLWKRMRGDLTGSLTLVRRGLREPRFWMLGALVACLLVGASVWRIADRAAYVRDDAWYTGVDHNLGDLPFHLAIIQGFVVGENFPPEHPELAGHRLTYPFMVDFIAAMLVASGIPLQRALLIENLLLGLTLVVVLYHWASILTRGRTAALVTTALVVLNGGLGWWSLAGELREPGRQLAGHLMKLPHDYTIQFEGGLRWGNAVITLLVPQRAWLLGLPLALIAWALWRRALADGVDAERAKRLMLAAGVSIGLTPLCHSHSFAVMMAMAACLSVLFPRRAWLAFYLAVALIATPQLLWMVSGNSLQAGRFLAWHPGWEAGETHPVSFWLRNTGLFIPLLLLAVAWRRGPVSSRLLRLYAPFALCFLVPNLLRLSPWIWDNVKFLFYWHLASAPLVALLLVRLARARPGALVAALLFASLTLSGALDVWRMVSGAVERRIFDAEAVAFAQYVERSTPPRARFVVAPTYNHPVLLAGRRVFMGYDGHLWSQGLEYAGRRQALEGLYGGNLETQALAKHVWVDYAVVGPAERALRVPPGVDERFAGRFAEVGSVGRYRLFRIAP